MVCYGPSKGCKKCRQRKIKCDERRPGCRNCEKSKKECPGYDRSNGTIAFHDETKTISKLNRPSKDAAPNETQSFASSKSSPSSSQIHDSGYEKRPMSAPDQPQRKPASSSRTGSISVTASSDSEFGKIIVQPNAFQIIIANELVPLGLPRDAEQQALVFFMTEFAASTNRVEDVVGGYLDPLPSLFEQASLESPLKVAMTTTAMATIAWTRGNEEFKPQSLSRYVTALQRINDALKDPQQSKSDDVLLAVLLLGFYENLKSLSLQRSSKDSHIMGAAAIVKARSPQSFHGQPSLRLYLAVRAKVLCLCIANRNPLPLDEFLAASEGAIPDQFVPTCADRLVMLSIELPRLCARESEMDKEKDLVTKRFVAQNLLTSAKELDTGLEYWTSTLPEEFLFSSLPLHPGPLKDPASIALYPHSIDIYCDHAAANIWNTWRMYRITVLGIIITCSDILNPPDPFSTSPPASQVSLDMLQHLAGDICATVPYHLGHHEKSVGDNMAFSDYPHPPGEAKWPENFRTAGIDGALLMMQPLSFVANLDCVPQSQKDWAKEYLTTFIRDPTDMRRISPSSQLQ